MVATLGAMVALGFTAAPLSVMRSVDPSEAIVLTEGYHPDSLRQLLQRPVPPRVFSYRLQASQAQSITNVGEWKKEFPAFKKVHLLGYGLPEYALSQLDSLPVVLHLSQPPLGFTYIHWPRQINKGERVRVSGQYHLLGASEAWLYLSVGGEKRDSVKITATRLDTTVGFQLEHQPKEAGSYLYQLQVQHGREQQTEPVPVVVRAPQPLRILILSAFPSFEIKFLKNLLAQQQHAVALRTQISQGQFDTEWLNQPKASLGRLSPSLLNKYDLLIADTQALQQLSASETQALQQAIAAEGLGLLALPDEWPLRQSIPLLQPFSAQRTTAQDSRLVRVQWSESEAISPEVTSIPYAFESTGATKSLVTESAGATLVAQQSRGWGKVAASLLTDTYRWALASKSGVYETYWTFLVQQLARKTWTAQEWTIPPLPVMDQPASLQLSYFTSDSMATPVGEIYTADSVRTAIHFRQDPLLPHLWTSTFWPESGGWHRVRTSSEEGTAFYVFAHGDWQTVRQAQRREQNRALHQSATPALKAFQAISIPYEVPAIYFFLLFLVCSGFLWLEEKL